MNFYQVAVNYPVKQGILTYCSENSYMRGQIVRVPLGKREELGVVLGQLKESLIENLKKIQCVEMDLKLTEEELSLYEWMANYYHYSLGKLIFDSLPSFLKRPKKLNLIASIYDSKNQIIPNEKQFEIIQKISTNLHIFGKYLIHGVTGSGKTVIYTELINKVINDKKSVLFLIPEINLTTQFIKTFSEQVKAPILLYHSEVTDSQKFQIWKKCQELSEPVLVLGVRSSIFMPLANLGLIIVDEEHDNSYKQDDRCPYNARDIAIKKAQILNLPIILGSATPSIETYFSFQNSHSSAHKFALRERARNSHLPKVILIDSRDRSKEEQGHWPLSIPSIELVDAALKRGEQVLVYINKLGYSSYVQCRSCGHQFQCPNCSIVLRHYKQKNQLACHHCDYKEPLPQQCSTCGCLTIIQKGFGTEKVKEVLDHLFPEYKIARFDRDEIKNMKELDLRMKDFHSGEIDVLVGTQMLSKGHNFERVKLVLILGIDSQINFPDFRSLERVYQTLTQVSGRAGRYSQDGLVAIQTNSPENTIFDIIKNHEFDRFYLEELDIRKNCYCPPYLRIVSLHFSSRFQEKLIDHLLTKVSPLIKYFINSHFSEVKLLGPKPAMIEKKSNQYTWSFLLKSAHLDQLHNLLKSIELNYKKENSITYKIDVDPYNLA